MNATKHEQQYTLINAKKNHYAVKETDATTLYMQLEKETRIKKFTGLPRFKPRHL